MDDTDADEDAGLTRKCSVADLPLECLQMIISYLHVRHWPQIELVNRRFRDGVLASWSLMKEVKLEQFCARKVDDRRKTTGKRMLPGLLRTIYNRSPNIRSIGGFSSFLPALGSNWVQELVPVDPVQLAKFRNLKSVTFLDCNLSVKTLANLATFLAKSESRDGLEELCVLYTVLHGNGRAANDNEKSISEALINKEGRPPLRLRKFRYEGVSYCPRGLLPSLDASNLEFLSLIEHGFTLEDVVELLSRCVHLKELHIDLTGWPRPAKNAMLSRLKSLPCRNLRRLGLLGWDLVRGSGITEALKLLALQCPALRILDLPSSRRKLKPNRGVLDVVGDCFSNLEELQLGTEGVPAATVVDLLFQLYRLKRLTISLRDYRRDVSGCIVGTVVLCMKNLTKLHLDLSYINADKLALLVELKKLKELSFNYPFVDKNVAVVCQRLRKVVVSLHLDRARNVIDQQLIAALGSRQTGIRSLSLNNCDMITGASLRAIADSCPLLEELNIKDVQATVSDVKNVIDKCKKLTRVQLRSSFPGANELIRDSPANIVLVPEPWDCVQH